MRSLLLAVLPLVGLAAAKDYQIRSDQDPVYHWYLQGYPGNASLAVLGPVNSSEYFNIDGTIQSVNTSLYLNIGSDSTSYKTLTFGAAANFDDWDLEGDTIATESSSSIGRGGFSLSFPCQTGGA